jgi:hypothetical protein
MSEVLPTPLPHQNYTLTPDAALLELVRASGNLHLAAERLRTTPAEIVTTIATDQRMVDQLNQTIRTTTLLGIFNTFGALQLIITQTLSDMEPDELRKLFSSMTEMIATFTDPKQSTTTNINVNEYVMRMLPPDVRKALTDVVEAETVGTPTIPKDI